MLGRVSVFDRQCASVYIAEKTDVAFRPLGLDLFDKLSDACEAVRKVLERERKNLAPPTNSIVPNVPEGTKVHQLLSHLTSLTDPETVKQLGSLSDEDLAELPIDAAVALETCNSATSPPKRGYIFAAATKALSIAESSPFSSVLTPFVVQVAGNA